MAIGDQGVRFRPTKDQNLPEPPPQNPISWYPGEDPNQISQQGQSYIDAGSALSNLFSGSDYNSFTTEKPVSEMSVWERIKNTLNPFGTATQRQNFNEDIAAAGDLLKQSAQNWWDSPAVSGFFGRDTTQASPSDIVSGLETTAPVAETVAGPSFEEYLAQYGGQFDSSPYDQAAQYMMDRRKAQLEAIQSMYNDYANEAAANAQRVADIYAGAEQGIGGTYEGAKAQTEAAYGSAQQQAADQLARLGIEAAAPAVTDPMALSQAESVSNLIANQAAGEGAIQRFGATGGDFASQMAQVAQQQAVENQRSATEQLADQLFQLEQQRLQAQAAYDPYSQAMNRLQAEQAFNQVYNPVEDTQAQADFLWEQEKFDTQNFQDAYFKYLDDANYDQGKAATNLLNDIQNGFLGPRLQQWVANNPDMVQQITG